MPRGQEQIASESSVKGVGEVLGCQFLCERQRHPEIGWVGGDTLAGLIPREELQSHVLPGG